ALDRLYARADRPRERLEVITARMLATPALRGALAREAAPLASALGETERAADLWQLALAAAPPEARPALLPGAVDALRAAGRSEAWAPLAEEELAHGAPPPARALAQRRALARTWRALGRGDRALAHARALADGEGAS